MLSLIEHGRWIVCDGKDCQARALAVIALQSLLHIDPETPFSTKGWLFVQQNERTRHYCPRCASHYLNALTEGNQKPRGQDS